jgi:hypothetical protein
MNKSVINARGGLLYIGEQRVNLPHADTLAHIYGFSSAEQFVRALETVDIVTHRLSKTRLPVTDERKLQNAIEKALLDRGVTFSREYPIGTGSRIDFMIHPGMGINIGIEVKIKGSASEIRRQIDRYARSERCYMIILVTNKAIELPTETTVRRNGSEIKVMLHQMNVSTQNL